MYIYILLYHATNLIITIYIYLMIDNLHATYIYIADTVVGISVAILIILFYVQRLGTDKVGFAFAPIVFVWFAFIGGIGIYNLFKHDIGVLRAFNPLYMIDYFKRNGRQGWVSLGGIFLCITGAEAMFADLGHFNIRAIQVLTTNHYLFACA